jgi:hypothetical protein
MHQRTSTAFRQQFSVILSAALGLLWAAPHASASGDYEYWSKATLDIPISENWEFSFEGRLSFDDEARRLADHQEDYIFTCGGLVEWLDVGLGFKKTLQKDGDEWLSEDRPYAIVIGRTVLAGIPVSSLSRFEYRIPEHEEESWQYRNRITVKSPATFTALKIQPYVAEEFFVGFDGTGLNQQRVYSGLYIPLHEQIRLDLFYLWKLDEQDDDSWHDTNVLGTFVAFQF